MYLGGNFPKGLECYRGQRRKKNGLENIEKEWSGRGRAFVPTWSEWERVLSHRKSPCRSQVVQEEEVWLGMRTWALLSLLQWGAGVGRYSESSRTLDLSCCVPWSLIPILSSSSLTAPPDISGHVSQPPSQTGVAT